MPTSARPRRRVLVSSGAPRAVASARALVLALLAASAALARGEEATDVAGLLNEPVVTTASKFAETAGLAPATLSIVTGDDLRRYGIDSLHDALNYLTTAMIAEASYGSPEIGARGTLLTGDYGNHVLLLLDGHVLNEPWDGAAYYDWSAGIPLDLVDHVEVAIGPGSVLYGSNAMLAVINVITRRARDYRGVHALAEGSFPAAGHVGLGVGAPLSLGGREGGLVAGVDFFRSDGPRLRYDRQPYAGEVWGGEARHRRVEVPAAYGRLVLGDVEVGVRAAASRRAATQILGDFDDPDNFERDRWVSAEVRWTRPLSRSWTVAARASADGYDYLAHEPLTASVDCPDGQVRCAYLSRAVSRWAGGELSATYDWAGTGRYVTLIGGEAKRSAVTTSLDYRDLDTGADSRVSAFTERTTTLAAYAQQTLHPTAWLSASAGLRLDHDPRMGGHLSPRAAAVFSLWRGGTFKAIYSEAFRAPSFYERFYSDPTNQLQAGDLRPETVRSVEGVLEQRLGAQRFRLGAFRTRWSQLVVTVPATDQQVEEAIAAGRLVPGATGVYLYANASRVDSDGLNADWEGSGMGQRLRYGASLTAVHTRAAGDRALPAAAQVFGNARVSCDLGHPLPTVGLALRAEAARPVGWTEYDPPPTAPALFEARLAVSGRIAAGLSYRLAADWTSTGRSPYAVGPALGPDNGLGYQPVLPLPRTRITAGLRGDW